MIRDFRTKYTSAVCSLTSVLSVETDNTFHGSVATEVWCQQKETLPGHMHTHFVWNEQLGLQQTRGWSIAALCATCFLLTGGFPGEEGAFSP